MSANVKKKSKSRRKSNPKLKTCRDVGFRSIKRPIKTNGKKSEIMTKSGVMAILDADLHIKFRGLCATVSIELSDIDELKADILNTFECLPEESWRVELKGKLFETITRYRKLNSGSEFNEIELEPIKFIELMQEVFGGFDLNTDEDELEELGKRKPKEVNSLFDGLVGINDIMDKDQKRASASSGID